MNFGEQFAAVFAATDQKNHIELQRFLLGVGDDSERYSAPVRNLFKHIAGSEYRAGRSARFEPVRCCRAEVFKRSFAALRYFASGRIGQLFIFDML